METVIYCSPLVPVEWLTAHGLQPVWWRPAQPSLADAMPREPAERHKPRAFESLLHGRRGVCPLAAAVVDTVASAGTVVLTTACDQMRYAASWREYQQHVPTFVMNVPSTWQTEASRSLYLEELLRLSRFLVAQGGRSPSREELAGVMRQFDRARTRLRQVRSSLTSREFAAALLAVREASTPGAWLPAEHQFPASAVESRVDWADGDGVPLALAGGPLSESDHELFDWIEQAGGRIVLDATEWGERTLPRAFAGERLDRDPLAELADAYFGTIPDVFRRPNSALYEYLSRELSDRHARGLIVRRYLWCDLWHAEVAPLKAWSPVPVLDLEAADSEASSAGRTRGRIEAFLEMLR